MDDLREQALVDEAVAIFRRLLERFEDCDDRRAVLDLAHLLVCRRGAD